MTIGFRLLGSSTGSLLLSFRRFPNGSAVLLRRRPGALGLQGRSWQVLFNVIPFLLCFKGCFFTHSFHFISFHFICNHPQEKRGWMRVV